MTRINVVRNNRPIFNDVKDGDFFIYDGDLMFRYPSESNDICWNIDKKKECSIRFEREVVLIHEMKIEIED